MVHLVEPHSNLIEIYPIVRTSLFISEKAGVKYGKERIREVMLYDEKIKEREIDEIAEIVVRYVNDDYFKYKEKKYLDEIIDDVVIRIFKEWKEFYRYLKNAYGFLLIDPYIMLMKYHEKNLDYKYYGIVVGKKDFIPKIVVMYPLVNLAFSYDSPSKNDLDDVFGF